MRRDFEALRMRNFSKYEVRAQIQRLRAHFNLLENHLLGLDWMRRPPWDRI